jgi:hypothetical protein
MGLLTAAIIAAAVVQGGAFTPAGQLSSSMLLAGLFAWGIARWRGSLDAAEWLALAVVLWGAVAAAVDGGHPLAAKEMLAAWLVAWLLVVVARRAGEGPDRWMAPVLAGAAVVVAVAAVLECAAAQRLRLGGLYVNPNLTAALLVPALPLLWRSWTSERARWLLPLTIVLVAGTVATGSRAGLLALVVAIGFAMAPGRVRRIAVAVAAIAVGGLMAWRFIGRPDSLAWHRLEIWRALAELVVAHPIWGVGPGWLEEATGVVRIAHAEPIARFRHVIGSAESIPMGLLVRTGFVGLGLGLWSVAAWFRRAWTEDILRRRPALSMVAAMAVIGAFHDILHQNFVLWWWALLLGLMLPIADRGRNSATDARPSPAPRLVTAAAVAGLVLWGLAQPAYARLLWTGRPSSPELAQRVLRAEPWLAEAARWQSLHLLDRPSWTWQQAAEALHWSTRAVRLQASSAGAWSELALVNFRLVEDLGGWGDAVERARHAFGRATALEPHLPWHWLSWAQFERVLGNRDEALRLAERAVEEEPLFVRAWLFVARVELDRGRAEAAGMALDRALEAHERARWRKLSEYERDLTRLPSRQRDQLLGELRSLTAPVIESGQSARSPTSIASSATRVSS